MSNTVNTPDPIQPDTRETPQVDFSGNLYETSKENDEVPSEGHAPVPAWLIALYIGFAIWGFYYIFIIGMKVPPQWR